MHDHKPETAAEVLAGLFQTMRQQSDGRKKAHGERWAEGWRAAINFMETRVQRDRIERALSAQGEAVGEVTIAPLVDVRWYENCGYGCDLPAGTKLYTHPAPSLVAQVEAVEYQFRYSCGNWSRCTRDEYESKAIDSSSPVTGVEFRALYTHPAPARVTVTDAMHVAAARAIWSIRRDEEDRCDQELEDLPPNHSVWDEARAALTAALEDDHE